MGRVWVAREQGLVARPRLVAIKTALAEEAASEDYWKVLLDEARIASQIQHPNVCSIHALDRERGVVYLVMDWSDGGSLRELLDELPNNRIEATIGARIIAHVCAGLHAAHELVGDDGQPLHVVHRDVSPQNVLISSNGQVKITDFGVAKARGQIHAATQTGEVKGKLSYMAPEQVTTRDVDRRADVFALGCVLYETTLGVRPFHGDDALSTLYQLLEQPIKAPTAIWAEYPPGLERIVLKALERDVDLRYQTTEEMGRALQMWLATERAMVADSDIGALVASALGSRVAERQKAVEASLTAIDSPTEAAVEPRPIGAETLSGSAASTLPGNQLARPPRKALWASLAGGAVVLSVVAALASRGSPPPAGPSPSASVVSPALTEPPAPTPARVEPPKEVLPTPAQEVTINLRAEPPKAELSLDDGPALPNPYTASLVPDGKLHRLRVRLAGFEDREQDITFDRSRDVVVVLRPSSTSNRKSTVRTGGTQQPAVVEPPKPQQPRMGDLPPVSKRVPRTLDNDNPFAQKP
jgi:serine/threonine protein kinase